MKLFETVVVPVEQSVFEDRYSEIIQKLKARA
jgi:hypothetical protein